MTDRQRWTLVATIIGSGAVFLDGTIVNVALPQDRPGAARHARRRPRGPGLRRQRLPRRPRRAAHPGRRAVATTTAGAASTRSAWPASRVTSALCGLAPNLELLVLFRLLQGAAGALLVPGSLSLITQAFEGAARGRAFGIWAASTSALTVLGPDRRRDHRRHHRLARRVPDQRPAARARAVGDADATSRSPATPRRAAGFDWLGALVAALAVGGLSFGLIRGPGPRLGGHARPGSRSSSARWRSSCSRSSWPAGRTRSCRSASSDRGRSRRSTSRRSSSTAPCT